jgi:hypothetical protein
MGDLFFGNNHPPAPFLRKGEKEIFMEFSAKIRRKNSTCGANNRNLDHLSIKFLECQNKVSNKKYICTSFAALREKSTFSLK